MSGVVLGTPQLWFGMQRYRRGAGAEENNNKNKKVTHLILEKLFRFKRLKHVDFDNIIRFHKYPNPYTFFI
jgi:hypothetical protein